MQNIVLFQLMTSLDTVLLPVNTVYNSICSYAECAGLYLDGARDTIFENNIIYGSMYGIEIGSEELQADYPVKKCYSQKITLYTKTLVGV